MALVYVLSRDGKVLMPTERCAHVRLLLKSKKARVKALKPFTIQLLYDSKEITQPVVLGIDPGRTNIGLCAVRETDGKPLLTLQAETRNKEIPKLMKERADFRRRHRSLGRRRVRQRRAVRNHTISPKCEKQETAQNKAPSKRAVKTGALKRKLPGYENPVLCIGIKNKEARFQNRLRPAGWLTPTAEHLYRTHVNLVRNFQRFLPVSGLVLEANKFAFMALEDPEIQKWQYECGPLYGYGGVKEVVSALQGGKCLLCGGKIEHYHHIVPKARRGSDTLGNLAGLCEACHRLVHTEEEWAEKLEEKKHGLNKKYGALSVLNQIIPKLCEEFSQMFPGFFSVTDGYSTKAFREGHGLPKDHYLDAYCIARSVLPGNLPVEIPAEEEVFRIRQFRRHDRRACHQERWDRKYYLGGTLVAVNRHKAIGQKMDSLEEYRRKGGCTNKLTVKEHPALYRRKSRILPGALFSVGGKRKVMVKSQGSHNGIPRYYYFTDGLRAIPKNCKFIYGNKGLIYV